MRIAFALPIILVALAYGKSIDMDWQGNQRGEVEYFTSYGYPCVGPCATNGYDYLWCKGPYINDVC